VVVESGVEADLQALQIPCPVDVTGRARSLLGM
jgi:hypothetical protein